MKKYNVKSIMNRAWEIKKSGSDYIFSLCLKMAWEEAKTEKKEFNGLAILNTDSGTKRFKLWSKYGKRRIYITREDGKKTYGYIDLDHDNTLVCDSDVRWALVPATEKFFEIYKIV
jgi:hypothetical protein